MTNIEFQALLTGACISSMSPDYVNIDGDCHVLTFRLDNGEEFSIDSVAMHGMDSRLEIVYKGKDIQWVPTD